MPRFVVFWTTSLIDVIDAFEDRPFEDCTDVNDAWWPLYIAVNKLLFNLTCDVTSRHFLSGDSSGLWCHPVDSHRIQDTI